MATWTTITGDTPINSAVILQEYIDALYERSRAAGTSFSPASFWLALKVQAGRTVSGTHGIAIEDEAVAAGLGIAWWYSLRLARWPVQPETLTITADDQVLEDDGNGHLCQGEDRRGLVDYNTGCLRFTFDDAVPEDEPITADYTADRTRLTASESCFTALHAGKRITVTGVGTFRILAVNAVDEVEVGGNAAASGATFGVSAAGTVLDAAFWARLQNALLDLVMRFVDSYTYPDGFEGESGIPLFDLPTWREAAGLTSGFPRCVPTLSPLGGVYDAETDTTALTFDGEGWFVAGHVGARINIHGVGTFVITSVEDGTNATVSGNAACVGRKFSVLPQDWADQADPAFGYTVAAAGDVLGPWLLADLQAGLKVLRWTTSSFYPMDPCYVAWGSNGEESWQNALAFSPTSYAQAKLLCEADWAAGSPQAREYPPMANASTFWNGEQYRAYLERCGNYIGWSVLGAAEDLACDLDLYVAARTGVGITWDDNGDWPVGYTPGTLTLWQTVAGLAEPTGLTDTIFGQRPPMKPNWPAGNPDNVGYIAGDYPVALCRWDIAGGFAYA